MELSTAFTPVCSCDHLPGYVKYYRKCVWTFNPLRVHVNSIAYVLVTGTDQILQLGVDEVYCISVNDAFVMRQWGLMQGLTEDKDLDAEPSNPLNPGNFTTIKLIPDGAAKFTKAMGMNCKLPQFPAPQSPPSLTRSAGLHTHSGKWENIAGFGERSWRYSAVFNDMKIEKLFLEVRHLLCSSLCTNAQIA